jgi:hypothetical protein
MLANKVNRITAFKLMELLEEQLKNDKAFGNCFVDMSERGYIFWSVWVILHAFLFKKNRLQWFSIPFHLGSVHKTQFFINADIIIIFLIITKYRLLKRF